MSQVESLMERRATPRFHNEVSQPVAQTSRKPPILRLLQPVCLSLGLGVGLQVVASICSALTFLALARMVSRLLQQTEMGLRDEPGVDLLHALDPAIVVPTASFLTALGLSALFGALALLVTHVADLRLQASLRRKLAAKLSRMPLGWFDERSSGRVRQLIQNDVDSLHQLVAHTLVELVAGILTPVTGLVVCFYLDWRLGLVAVIPLILYAVTFSVLSQSDNRMVMEQIHEGLAKVSDAIVEYVNGVAVLKIFGRSSQGFGRFTHRSEEFLDDFGRLVGPQMRAQSIAVVFLSAAVVGAFEVVFGLWFVHAGWTTPANLLVVTVIAMLIPAAMQTVAVSNQARRQATDAATHVVELLDAVELKVPTPEREHCPKGSAIDITDVTFSYDTRSPALQNVTLHIPEGTITALVGPSGSGKSTLAALIARYRDCDAGCISVGGADIRKITPERLRATIGTVFQDTQLLNLSVADNIRMGMPGASLKEIERVAKAANIDEKIRALPRGYNSVIGEDARLSGGEQQRIAIARSLLANTPVLVLDEATSATDPENETAVQEGLNQLVRGRTVVVIAHRLNTISEADQIVVMDRGRIVEIGTHDALLADNGLYARMWQDMESYDAERNQ